MSGLSYPVSRANGRPCFVGGSPRYNAPMLPRWWFPFLLFPLLANAAPARPPVRTTSSAGEAALVQLTHREPAQRLAAIEAIRKLERPELYDALFPRLDDPEESVQRSARATLLTLGDAAVPALVRIFTERKTQHYRQAFSLCSPLGADALPVYAAAIALTDTPLSLSVLQNLRTFLRKGAGGSRDVVLLATELVRSASDPVLKEAALRALADHRHLGPDPLPALSLTVHDPLPVIRELSMNVLANTESPEAIPLLGHGARDPEKSVRQRAMRGLFTLRHPDAVPYALPHLQHADPDMRSNAVLILTSLKDPSTLSALETAVEKETTHLQALLRMILDPAFDEERLRVLTRFARHADPEVRTQSLNAVSSLREHRSRSAYLPLLKHALNDPDPRIPPLARRALDLFGESEDNPFTPQPSGE